MYVYLYTCVYTYTYMYMHVCTCICMCVSGNLQKYIRNKIEEIKREKFGSKKMIEVRLVNKSYSLSLI